VTRHVLGVFASALVAESLPKKANDYCGVIGWAASLWTQSLARTLMTEAFSQDFECLNVLETQMPIAKPVIVPEWSCVPEARLGKYLRLRGRHK
jgi:hypothetical protein